MDLSNCNIDYIKTFSYDNIGMKSAYIFPYFLSVFINIHEYANYANMMLHILPWNERPMS